jgi:hypothetical protein
VRVSRFLSSGVRGAQNIRGSLEDVGDSGETHLKTCFGQAAPSYPPQPEAALLRSKDFLDPAAYALHAIGPALQLAQGVVAFPPPDAGLSNVRKSDFGANCRGERVTPIAAVRVDEARIIRQGAMSLTLLAQQVRPSIVLPNKAHRTAG